MAFERFGKFLLTESGRSFCMYTTLTIGTGIFAAKVLPNTIFVDKYKEVIHLYRHGVIVPVPEDLMEKFNKAVDLVEIPTNDRHLYRPFMVYGFDVYNIGSAYSKFGAFVGIPRNFTYTHKDDVEKTAIRVNDESVLWEMDEGQQFLESMMLSENAQLYGIARELKMLSSPKLLLDTFYQTFSVISCYGLAMFFNRRLNMVSKPRFLRFCMYGLVGAFTFGNYILFKDVTQVHYEQSIDQFLKEKDPIFAEGGKEYYEKILMRNMALRKLMGKAGESHYTALGNENYLFRHKHMPLVHRKEFFEETKEYA